MSFLSPTSIVDAKAHARSCYPEESCGLVVDGFYVPCANLAEDPTKDFEISPTIYARYLTGGHLQAVLHSHPNGPVFPSLADMQGQLQTNIVWGIIALDEDRCSEPLLWGDALPLLPVLGRQFVHGVTDCYSLIRDTYRTGREALAAQGIDAWPHPSITLPEVPRADGWWNGTDDFYSDCFPRFGFREVKEPQPGDVFLMKIRSEHKFNHAGMLLDGGLILHHLPERLSRREPAGIWARQVEKWIRFGA